VDERLLISELELLHIPRERIIVDPRAVLLLDSDRDDEARQLSHIASTLSGTGAALLRRMSRSSNVLLAQQSDPLRARCRVESVAPLLHDALDRGEHVVVEGTQGFGLSLLHGPTFPYVTSRDTTAAGFAMEAGLSPRHVSQIVMVVRTFPIRVGGSSGPLRDEISWEDIRLLSNAPSLVEEYTSVTKRLRRVAHFDLDLVIRACNYNAPTSLAVMGLDRLDYANTGITIFRQLTERAKAFVNDIQVATNVPVEFCGTGFRTFDVAIEQPTAITRMIDHVQR
jgi:adenylosuccinate synthase